MTRVERRLCQACKRNRALRFFAPAGRICETCRRAKRRTTQRRRHVETTYGLPAATHAALLASQGGVCAICGGARRYQLQVDHDHATGAVRGLLCKRCNRLLAVVGDDPAVLATAAAYLTMPPMKRLAAITDPMEAA